MEIRSEALLFLKKKNEFIQYFESENVQGCQYPPRNVLFFFQSSILIIFNLINLKTNLTSLFLRLTYQKNKVSLVKSKSFHLVLMEGTYSIQCQMTSDNRTKKNYAIHSLCAKNN